MPRPHIEARYTLPRCRHDDGPIHAGQSLEDVDTAERRLAELSDMSSKGELLVLPDSQENREGIAEHYLSVNGEVGLPGRFCTTQAEEGCLAIECVEGQSCHSRPRDHFIYILLSKCDNHPLIAGAVGYHQIISIDTHTGIVLQFDQNVIYVDSEDEGKKDGALGQTILESTKGAYGADHSHSRCAVYEPRG